MTMTVTAAPNAWITRPFPVASPELRLFCFPHAGSGVAQFRLWATFLPENVELCPIRLPGRESRLREAPFTRLLAAAEGVRHAILPYLDRPFALFGHSMGALMAYELARKLASSTGVLAQHLFVSGRRAPHLPEGEHDMHALPDDAFVGELARRYGEASTALLRDPELSSLFMPVLRADFEAVETYQYVPGELLTTPITAFGGLADPRADEAELDAWRQHTSSTFRLRRFAGDHFFINSARPPLLAEVVKALR